MMLGLGGGPHKESNVMCVMLDLRKNGEVH